MISHTIHTEDAIVVVEPSGQLSADDFTRLAEPVDKFLENHDHLKGLLIHFTQFPGWEDFEGFISHLKFVKNHHQKIRRVALVTDSKLASTAPKLATHFVAAEVRTFDYDKRNEALTWLRSE